MENSKGIGNYVRMDVKVDGCKSQFREEVLHVESLDRVFKKACRRSSSGDVRRGWGLGTD